MNPKETNSTQVICPYCKSILKIDPETGEIVFSQKHEKKEVESFDAAVAIEKEREKNKASLFEQAIELEKKRKELLEKKFQEAQKSTSDDAPPPLKPIDLD